MNFYGILFKKCMEKAAKEYGHILQNIDSEIYEMAMFEYKKMTANIKESKPIEKEENNIMFCLMCGDVFDVCKKNNTLETVYLHGACKQCVLKANINITIR